MSLSHIIPEFLYSPIYDEKHRFHALSISREQKNRLHQKGIRERLLCEDCEQKFSKWERYASQVLNGGATIVAKREGNLWHLSNLDYSSFRLFQLSVLWRSSVSTHDFFTNVSLGIHEEKIRKLLIANDPGLPWQYGCVMCGLIADEAILTDLMIQPGRLKLHSIWGIRRSFAMKLWLAFKRWSMTLRNDSKS